MTKEKPFNFEESMDDKETSEIFTMVMSGRINNGNLSLDEFKEE